MAHPYKDKRADKVGKDRAKEFVAKKAEGGRMEPISKPNARSITEVGMRTYGRELGRREGGKFGANPYKNPAATRREIDEEMPRKEGGRVAHKNQGGSTQQEEAQQQRNPPPNPLNEPYKPKQSSGWKKGGRT